MKRDYLHLVVFLFASVFFGQSCKKDESTDSVIERGTVTDVTGNTYQTVKIGGQWWMAENLRTTQFNDGTPLNFIGINDADSLWANTVMASYTFINDSLFGHLYNGLAINAEKNLAPAGWHIPTDEDWKILEATIGMQESEINQTGWRGTNEGEQITIKYSAGWPEVGLLFGTDEFGFRALPGGCRIFDGRTNIFTNTAFWWTRSAQGSEIWYRYIDANEKRIFRQHTYPQYGMSVRCVKD